MKKITVVGAGSLGSNFIWIGRNLSVEYKIIDFDRVEQKNLLNQFYIKPNVGKNKAQSLAQNMISFFGKKIEAIPHRLTKDNVNQLLSNSNIIMDCLDNPESRKIVKDFAVKNKIPSLHGALAAEGKFAVVEWGDQFEIDEGKNLGTATCHDEDHVHFIMNVAAYMVKSVKVFLEDKKQINFYITPTSIKQK